VSSRLGWYGRRLAAMSPSEVGWRLHDQVLQEAWCRRHYPAAVTPATAGRRPPAPAPADLSTISVQSRRAVLAAADQLLAGRAEILGVERLDMDDPDWALDPVSGQAYPSQRCAFHIDFRSGEDGRNVKQVWELSRHHHLTVLACAWKLSGDDRYAERAARHLRSWWQRNPVLDGINWTSGIELGIRLISWTWTRRLLSGWPGAAALFEDNETAAHQLYWHQRYLATFRSRGSSANNHVVAEAAGQLVAACAFPWFPESERWRADAARLLQDELTRNVDAEGIDREQAFDYHGLVAELGLVAAAEAESAGAPLEPGTWALLCKMVDAAAAAVDASGRAPRHGDGDDGRALVVTDPAADRWGSLLATGAALFGPESWWPPTTPDPQSVLLSGLVGRRIPVAGRPPTRASHFAESGLTLLRTDAAPDPEIWCRCDSGPHGFLSIAAHGHADALSVEVRHDGVDVLCDPGTYCYHGEPQWRRYFRSTLGHNTVELDEEDQSVTGGPFLWVLTPRTTLLMVGVDADDTQTWSAEHDGYLRLDAPALHRRSVTLDPKTRELEIIDVVESAGPHHLRLAFHLGPAVQADLEDRRAGLRWTGRHGTAEAADMALPPELDWQVHRGEDSPVLGWYSAGFGRREPTTVLVGSGRSGGAALRTVLGFSR
jgi:Heparinase II/III-like protein/Heparinase II/III N-terminus